MDLEGPQIAGIDRRRAVVLVQREVAAAVPQVIVEHDLPGQGQARLGVAGRQGCEQLGLQHAAHAVAQVAAERAGQRGQRLLGGGLFDLHPRQKPAQALHERQPLKLAQRFQALVADIQGEVPVPLRGDEPEVPGDEAVPAQPAVHFRAFQQNAGLSAHKTEIQADGRLHVGREPFSVMLQMDVHTSSVA